MSRDIKDSIQDILDVINRIEKFTQGINFDEFNDSEEKIFAVEKCLEIIGEAIKNIPQPMRDNYPQIPWKQITGMRDKIAHQYWRIDVAVIWKATTKDISKLKLILIDILDELK